MSASFNCSAQVLYLPSSHAIYLMLSPSFTLKHVFDGHSHSVTAVDIHPHGRLLISADDHGLIAIWDLHSGEQKQEIQIPHNGPVVALRWTSVEQETDTFAIGCGDGSVLIYTRRGVDPIFRVSFCDRAHEGPVEDLAYDSKNMRVASVGGGILQVWTLNNDQTLTKLHVPPPKKPFIARCVQFCDYGESVLVFFLESHEIIAYNVQPFNEKWVRMIPTRIGHAAFSRDQRTLLISNLVNGIDAYMLSAVSSSMQNQQSFRYAIRCNVPLQVTTAMQGSWVISGSDDGTVRLYDQRSAEMIKCLHHADVDTLVQVVAAYSESDKCLIISASSSPGPSTIKVWLHSPVISTNEELSMQRGSKTWYIYALLCLISFALAVVIGNFSIKSSCAWLLEWAIANDVIDIYQVMVYLRSNTTSLAIV